MTYLIDVLGRSAFMPLVTGALISCGGAHPLPAKPPEPVAGAVAEPVARSVAEPVGREPDPDLHRPRPRRLLDIDWAKLPLTSAAEAVAAWRRIAPSGADWDDKLQEVPAEAAGPLALAVLRGGNFTCSKPPPPGDCARPSYDVEAPAETAGFDDPCLRRLLALWALAQLDEAAASTVVDALRAIAAIPPPESQLVAAALHALPETAQDARLELLAIAWRAGQHELVDSTVGTLDEPHLIEAVRRHRIAGALEILSAEGHREVYLAAVSDEALDARARATAIIELVAAADKLPRDLQAALVTAARSKDCSVAAVAARALEQRGDRRFVPRRPRSTSIPQLMRGLCVLASYESLQPSDEASLLASYLPARGLERVTISYDALSDTDPDGDGDPHTAQVAELVPRSEAVLPELTDLIRAMKHCAGTICVSDDRELRLVWSRAGELTRIELTDRPPCPVPKQKP
jgi:hypothetical protein